MEGAHLLAAPLDEPEVFADMLSSGADPCALLDRDGEADAEAMEAVGALMREVLSLLAGGAPRQAAPTHATSRTTHPQRDETVVQFSVRGPKWIADQFRALCTGRRSSHTRGVDRNVSSKLTNSKPARHPDDPSDRYPEAPARADCSRVR